MPYNATPGSGYTFASATMDSELYPYLVCIGVTTSITVSPVLSVGGTYAAGDYMGVNQTPLTFSGIARVSGGSGVILGATLVDADLQSASCELWVFDQSVTPTTDNAAFALNDTDAAKCIGVIPFSTYYATTGNSVSPQMNQNIPYRCASGTTAAYGTLVARTTAAYMTTGLTVRLLVSQD